MSGITSDVGEKRRSDNIRTGIILGLVAAAFFIGFFVKMVALR